MSCEFLKLSELLDSDRSNCRKNAVPDGSFPPLPKRALHLNIMKYFDSLVVAILLLAPACFSTSTSDDDVSLSMVNDVRKSSSNDGPNGSSGASTSTTINVNVTNKLRSRYSSYRFGTLSTVRESEVLLKDFESVRQTDGWMAFVKALQLGDTCVNLIADEPMLQWTNGASILTTINVTRDAWRRASSYGIEPPKLAVGHVRFVEGGLAFHVHVLNASKAVLLVRASRGQILGIFELVLASNGSQHVATHMLERVFVAPEGCLNSPWDNVMAQDSVEIKDVHASFDRVGSIITVR